MSYKFCIDMDCVVADFVTAFAKLKGVIVPNPWPDLPNRYDLSSALKIDGGRFFEGCDYNFWTSLELLADGKEVVNTVSKMGQIAFLTKINTSMKNSIGVAVQGKYDWLCRHFPGQVNLMVEVDVGKEFVANNNMVLIDDSDQNVEVFVKSGGRGITFPRPWNKLHGITDPLAYVKEKIKELK